MIVRLPFLCLLVLSLAACGGGSDNSSNATAHTPPANRTPVEAPIEDRDRARELFDKAGELSLKGDNTGAAEKLEQAVKLSPRDGEILARLGHVYFELMQYDDARDAFIAAGDYVADDVRRQMATRAGYCAYRIAFDQISEGLLADALPNARQAVELTPADRAAQLQLGMLEFKLQKYKESAETYRQVLALSTGTDRYEALAGIGQGLFYAEDYEGAHDAYSDLIEVDALGFEAYGWRAYCLYKLGKLDEAERDFQVAVGRTEDPVKRAEYEEALRQLEARE